MSGIAMGDTTVVETNVSATSAPSWVKKSNGEWVDLLWKNINATNLTTDFKILGITRDGHYVFSHTGAAQNASYPALSYADNTVTITGRAKTSGETFYTDIVSVSSLLGGQTVENLESLSVIINGRSTSSSDSWWGVYKMDSNGSMTELSNLKSNSLKSWTSGDKMYTLTDAQIEALSATDKLVVMFREAAVQNLSITGIRVEAVVVPEPTTATLSLLALAGLLARRRRK